MPPLHTHARRILPFPCHHVYAVVVDVESYPAFVPGWRAARVVRRAGDTLTVTQEVGSGPLAVRFASRARQVPGRALRITSDDGPFRRLVIDWCFTPVGDGRCEVRLAVSARLRAGPLAPLLRGLLAARTERLLDLFTARAAALWAEEPE